ncbi:MAG: rhomboid family intramembrane serine protease [Lachnospiraceae bacterium]|nr:rhomboid family intramembrane serine protease [Lachnospiraceae bacterium]
MSRNDGRWKIVFNAPTVIIFGIICVIALILGIITGGTMTQKLFMTYRAPLSDPLTWVRFFTHVCGHSSWEHLLGNMSYILLLGPMLEEKYGSRLLLIVIAITALVTGVLNFILFPDAALLGASGVAFAFIILSSITGFNSKEIPLTFILVAVIYLGQQVYSGLFVSDNIANFAHIIGGLVGACLGFFLNRRY